MIFRKWQMTFYNSIQIKISKIEYKISSKQKEVLKKTGISQKHTMFENLLDFSLV
jgi:hypothetical protein